MKTKTNLLTLSFVCSALLAAGAMLPTPPVNPAAVPAKRTR